MADENTTPTPATDPAAAPADGVTPAASVATQAPPSTPPVRTFTQEEVNRIAAEAREAGRRAASNAAPAPRPDTQRAAPSAPATDSARLDRIEAENVLYRAASRLGVSLSDEQEADLLALYTVQKPEQPGEWFGRKVAAFNLKPAAPPAPPTIPPANPGATPAPPVPPAAASTTAPGAPTAPVPGALIDASRLTPAQLAQMTPQALVQAVGSVVQAGAGASGLPVPPHLRLRKP